MKTFGVHYGMDSSWRWRGSCPWSLFPQHWWRTAVAICFHACILLGIESSVRSTLFFKKREFSWGRGGELINVCHESIGLLIQWGHLPEPVVIWSVFSLGDWVTEPRGNGSHSPEPDWVRLSGGEIVEMPLTFCLPPRSSSLLENWFRETWLCYISKQSPNLRQWF